MLAILWYVGRWMLFWWDDWRFIFHRPDPSVQTLFAPVFDTLAAVPILVYQLLLAVFGLRTYLPYLLVGWLAHFAVVVLVYRILSRRSGVVIGLTAGASVLFLGAGYEVLLQPFQIQYLFAFVGGLLAVDLLDNQRPKAAALALVPAIASSGLGVILASAIAAWGLARRNPGTVAVAAPGLLLYTAWFLTWGQQSERLAGPGLDVVGGVISVLIGLGAGTAGIMGLPLGHFPLVGLAIDGAGLAFVAARWWRGHRRDPLLVFAITALIAVQILRVLLRGQYGVDYGATRSGYVYIAAVLSWLAVGSILGKPRLNPKWLRMSAALLVGPMMVLNMIQLAAAAMHYRGVRATELAELRLIETYQTDPRLDPNAHLDDVGAVYVEVRPYLEAVKRFGRPSLPYDWRSYADSDAVDEARSRLLR